jgi:hypothetical protein
VTQVEFAHDGATLVSGSGGTTCYWDVPRTRVQVTINGTYVIHLFQILEEPLKVSLFADRVE